MDGLTKFFLVLASVSVLVITLLLTWGVEWRG